MVETMIEYCEKTAAGVQHELLDFERHAFGFLEYFCEAGGTLNVAVGECLKEGKIDRAPGKSRFFHEVTVADAVPGKWQRVIFPEHETPAYNI